LDAPLPTEAALNETFRGRVDLPDLGVLDEVLKRADDLRPLVRVGS
jgi:hypothetical protein